MDKAKYNNLRDQFSPPQENYEILNENQIVFSARKVWDADYVRERHLGDVDRLIGLVDGSITDEARAVEDLNNPELGRETPDVLIALDKSARPAVDMMNAFWDQLARPDAERPEVDYLNIDRIDWLEKMGYTQREAETSDKKKLDWDKIPREEIARIRAYFTVGDLTEDNWQEEVWNLPTRLDDKKIMVLDEVQNSGATLKIAVGLLRLAVPEARVVTGDVFWTDTTNRTVGGSIQYASAPVWYDRATEMGRGIGDVSVAWYNHRYEQEPTQDNLKRKIASFVLSAPHHDRRTMAPLDDDLYKKLMQDVAYMTYDYADGKILRNPGAMRSDDDWDGIVEQQGFKVPEYVEYLRARKEDNEGRARRFVSSSSKRR